MNKKFDLEELLEKEYSKLTSAEKEMIDKDLSEVEFKAAQYFYNRLSANNKQILPEINEIENKRKISDAFNLYHSKQKKNVQILSSLVYRLAACIILFVIAITSYKIWFNSNISEPYNKQTNLILKKNTNKIYTTTTPKQANLHLQKKYYPKVKTKQLTKNVYKEIVTEEPLCYKLYVDEIDTLNNKETLTITSLPLTETPESFNQP